MSLLKVLTIAFTASIGSLVVLGWAAQLFDDGNSREPARQAAWIEQGRAAVREQLKDGSSAIFRDSFFSRGNDGIPAACGYVNAKNSFGGYSGPQRFVYMGSGGTFLEEQVSDFSTLWRRYCL